MLQRSESCFASFANSLRGASIRAVQSPTVPAVDFTRRAALAAGGVILLGLALPAGRARAGAGTAAPADPNAFIRLAADDSVTLVIKHVEMGQGIATGLATLLAEELDADWTQLRIEFAPNDEAVYKNLLFGTMASGGSTGISNSWLQMRRAGAAARAMLVTAAARRWGVPEATVTVANGVVSAPGRHARFGELASDAAQVPPPADPPLKDPARFALIGRTLPKLDTAAKCDGTAVYTMDVRLPGMIYAVIEHPPAFGAKVGAVDPAAALGVPGVVGVRQVPSGVAVYARDSYAAQKGRAALSVTWDERAAERRSSAQLFEDFEAAAATPGTSVITTGQPVPAFSEGAHRLEGTYRFPYLAHAPMEPLDAVIQLKDGKLDLWMGTQFQSWDTKAVAEVLGVPLARTTLHECLAGGSFGRRATLGCDFAREAAEVYRAWGSSEPIKFFWTRENDITGGFYRPLIVHRVTGAIGADGRLLEWNQAVVGQSFVFGSSMSAAADKRGWDSAMVEGSNEPLYRIAAHRLTAKVMHSPVPTSWWRSVGFTHNAYVVETFVDELLAQAGKDAVAGRLALCDDPRAAAVLRRVAELSGWGTPPAAGRARGVALVKSFKSYVAEVAEVSRGTDGLPRVHQVWAAVDCGVAVNPDIIRAQIEGGIGFALGHILHAEVELGDGGRVQARNFDYYRSLRIAEMPEVTVAIVASAEPPTGIGEPGVPPLGPAVANAWRRLTGDSVRQLPFARYARRGAV